MTIVIAATVLLLVGVAILPINEASARVCNNDNHDNSKNDNNNDDDDDSHSTTCTHQQNSNNHDHSTQKDTTPLILPVPFP
jgi:ABC-type Zn2+ transport system substrate-binding protein/surface adhesin